MRLGLKEGWAGRKRKTALCPNCSSDRARYSRRHYEGPWFLLFRVRPVKCSDCGSYFPIAGDATITRPETDPVDLHIPFRPSELDPPVAMRPQGAAEDPGSSPGATPSRVACPACGSRAVRPSNPGGDQPLTRRLDVKTTYRCARCNGSFKRTDPVRLLAFVLIVLGVLGGLSYFILAAMGGHGESNRSPRIKKDQIKPPPPPVFR